MKKILLNIFCKLAAPLVFAFSVFALVAGLKPFQYLWLVVAFCSFICGVMVLIVRHLLERVQMLASACNYKDDVIKNLHEQRNGLYEKIARLTDECNNLRSQLKAWESETDKQVEETAIDVSLEEYRKNPICVSVDEAREKCPALLSDDNIQINIIVTPDKALLSMSGNLYIQPKDEFSRWWKIRGYDTELPKANKEYYIYIRLAHKGFDGEVRFLAKPRLVQNEVHRFIQVGTISPVTGGRRTVSYSLDGFRFKQIRKGRADASK